MIYINKPMAMQILVVDDEIKIVNIVKAYLEREGYQVAAAYDGETALEMIRRQSPALVILDLMLPKIGGWDICRITRSVSDTPIIMLTARDDVSDKIVGLELGADDYITKPFDPKELVSRVKAVLRRYKGNPQSKNKYFLADIIIDLEKREVKKKSELIELTPIEFDLLVAMAKNPGRVYTRMQLLDEVQGDAYEGYERAIDSHIKNIRKKIEPDSNCPKYITTIYGVGYKVPEVINA